MFSEEGRQTDKDSHLNLRSLSNHFGLHKESFNYMKSARDKDSTVSKSILKLKTSLANIAEPIFEDNAYPSQPNLL